MRLNENKQEGFVFKNGIFIGIRNVLDVAFLLFYASYAARVLSPDGVGKVAYGQNIVSYFLLIAAFGIPYYGTREIARCRNFPKEKNKLFSELVTLNFISTAICLLAYSIFVILVFPDSLLLYAICGLELLLNFTKIEWLYEGEEDYAYITLRSLFVRLLSVVALVLLVRDKEDYVLYALVHCIRIGGNHFINSVYARKKVRLNFRGMDLKHHVRPLFFIMLSAVASGLYTKVDVTMLGWLSGDVAVGWYANAYKMIQIVLMLVISLSSVFFPRLSYAYATDREKYQEYISVGLKAVLLLAIPCCAGILIVAPNLLDVLFGEEFVPGTNALRILAPYVIVRGVGDLLCYQAIISSGNESKLIGAYLIAGAVCVAMNALLIPHLSQNGAAISAVVSELVVSAVLLPVSLKIARPKLSLRFFISVMIGTVLMCAAALVVQHFLATGVISLVATVMAGVVAYAAGLVITKNEMLTYIKAALRKKK